MKKLLIGLAVVTLAFFSCKNDKKLTTGVSDNVNLKDLTVLTDSVVYGIITHATENIDPYENEEFKSFLQDKLIGAIFEQLYAGKLKAYDFFSNKELSIEEIRNIEKKEGFSRAKVGKVQFNEQWYFDNKGVLTKRVNSMTFGVESYSNQGNFTGYNALFKIKF
jgi:hypothetical protein